MGTLYSEMEPHDRMLDVFFNQIRKDSFDETISTQALKKSIEYFQVKFSVFPNNIFIKIFFIVSCLQLIFTECLSSSFEHD